jgi:diguanylate cyclase (GGDEF)-like protein/PAS domain S-box-containing protein
VSGHETGLTGNAGNWINSILHMSIDVYIYLNGDGIIQYVSPNIERILGFSAEKLIGTEGLQFTQFGDLPAQDYFYLETADGAGMNSSELRIKRADGSWLDVEVIQVNVSPNSEAEGVVIAIRDITQKKSAENIIYHAAYHDYVTDLPNRRLFQEELEQQAAMYQLNKKKIALLMFSLDQFKLINDSLGHSSGDELLRKFVSKLQEIIIPGRKAYRIGNDDFCILFSDVQSNKEVHDFAELFVRAVRDEQFIVNNYHLRLTISAGIATLPSDGENTESLLRNAIAALNYAKEQGRDQVRSYSTSLNVHAFKRFTLHNDLYRAIENNELFLEYMPIAESDKLDITGAEALVRWQHPDWGVVMPEEFIPIAEETGLIDRIGEWVIVEATRMNQSWIDKGLTPIVMAVNVSSRQLLNRSFVDIVDRCLEKSKLSPEYLEIEITESVAINDIRDVRSILQDLKKRKIKISLDDFGAGFSSLHQLANLPFNKLKIDRSFVKDNLVSNDSMNVVEHIIGLAKTLNVGIVAEGVESEEHYKILKKLGCNEIQGFFLSPPLTAEEFEKSLKHRAFKSKQQEIARDPFSNRRKYFRLDMENPLIADLTISMFKGKKVNLGSTQAYISNIGPSGLKFVMNIKFPINDDIILVFKTQVLNTSFTLNGKVVWLREVDSKGIFEYGVYFVIEPKEQDELIQILNRLAIYMRDGLPPHTTIYLGDPIPLLKESRK